MTVDTQLLHHSALLGSMRTVGDVAPRREKGSLG